MLKKGIVTLLGALLIFSSPILTQAGEQKITVKPQDTIIVQPFYVDIKEFLSNFNILSNGEVTIDVYLSTHDNTDQTKVQAYLERYINSDWVIISSWEESSSNGSCSLSKVSYVGSGYYYRLITIGTVYKNGAMVEQAGKVSNTLYY